MITQKLKERDLLILIVIGGFLVRYLLRGELLGYIPDSYEYAIGARELCLSGKYLIRIGDLSFPAFYPIGMSLLLLLPFKIFGVSGNVAILTMVVISTLTIPAVYALGTLLLESRARIIACIMTAFLPCLIFYGARVVMSEIPAMLFVTLTLFGVLKSVRNINFLIPAAVFASVLFLLRPYLAFLIFPPVVLYLVLNKKDILEYNKKPFYANIISSIIISIIPVIYYFWYITYYFAYMKNVGAVPFGTHSVFALKHFLPNLSFYSHYIIFPFLPTKDCSNFNVARLFMDSKLSVSFAISFLYILGLLIWYRKGKRREALFFFLITFLAFIFQLFYFYQDARFFIPYTAILILPASTILSGGVNGLSEFIRVKEGSRLNAGIVKIYLGRLFIFIVIFWILFFSACYYLRSFGALVLVERRKWENGVSWVNKNTEKDAILVTNINPTLAGFYTDRTIIPLFHRQRFEFPEPIDESIIEKINRYKNSGRPVYLILENHGRWVDTPLDLYDIVHKFNIIYKTHKFSFQVFQIGNEKCKECQPASTKVTNKDMLATQLKKIDWYFVAVVNQWVEKNTDKSEVIITNLYPFMQDFFSGRKVAYFSNCSDLDSNCSPVSRKPLSEMILEFQQGNLPVYIVIFETVNWPKDAQQQLQEILAKFNSKSVLGESGIFPKAGFSNFAKVIKSSNSGDKFISFLSKFIVYTPKKDSAKLFIYKVMPHI